MSLKQSLSRSSLQFLDARRSFVTTSTWSRLILKALRRADSNELLQFTEKEQMFTKTIAEAAKVVFTVVPYIIAGKQVWNMDTSQEFTKEGVINHPPSPDYAPDWHFYTIATVRTDVKWKQISGDKMTCARR